jgi:hypothetical protein
LGPRGRLAGVAIPAAILLSGQIAGAVFIDATPHDYDHVPPPGTEGGTYHASFRASILGCFFTAAGTAKLLPNPDGTGGKHCFKTNNEVDQTLPECAAVAPLLEAPIVGFGEYTYNGDGTLCENLKVVGGPFDGTPVPFLTYVDPDGKWLMVHSQDATQVCPGLPPNGFIVGDGRGDRIGRQGDDPSGSGELACPP